MTSKNNFCKCTQRLLHDGHPQEPGPRHLLMPQAAYVDWPKIATARFHLRFLPTFPPSYKCKLPTWEPDWFTYKKMCSIMSKSAFAAVHSPFSLKLMNFHYHFSSCCLLCYYTFLYFLASMCFLYFSCLHFYLFLWALKHHRKND